MEKLLDTSSLSIGILIIGLFSSALIIFKKRRFNNALIKIIMVIVLTIIFLINIYGRYGQLRPIEYLYICPIGVTLGLVAIIMLILTQGIFDLLLKNMSRNKFKLYKKLLSIIFVYSLIIFIVSNYKISIIILAVSTIAMIIMVEIKTRRPEKRIRAKI